jgi:hypothetical protein
MASVGGLGFETLKGAREIPLWVIGGLVGAAALGVLAWHSWYTGKSAEESWLDAGQPPAFIEPSVVVPNAPGCVDALSAGISPGFRSRCYPGTLDEHPGRLSVNLGLGDLGDVIL